MEVEIGSERQRVRSKELKVMWRIGGERGRVETNEGLEAERCNCVVCSVYP